MLINEFLYFIHKKLEEENIPRKIITVITDEKYTGMNHYYIVEFFL